MTTWEQAYNPLHSVPFSAAVAAIPLAILFYLLIVRRTPGYLASLAALLSAVIVAVLVYRMPIDPAIGSMGAGMFFGVFPIFWIIFTSIFIYNLAVETGQFEIVKSSIVLITEDSRLQVLLIAFCFGAFLEGAAGFGAPVAITAGMLAGLGFRPLYAAGLCLIANTAPVAFGSVGIPIITAANVTGLDAKEIGAVVGHQLPFLSIIVPFWIVMVMVGLRKTWEVLPACLVAGGSFALIQFASSNWLGPELPDILSALGSILCLIVLLRFWKPKTIWKFSPETPESEKTESVVAEKPSLTAGTVFKAWSPFLLLTVMILVWSIKPVNDFIDSSTTVNWPVGGLHRVIVPTPPVGTEPLKAIVKLNWLGCSATAIFIAGILSAAFYGFGFKRTLALYGRTFKQLLKPLVNVSSILGLAYIMNYSGMSSTFGLILAGTGSLFPFFSPLLGWIGVFLTGSDTSSNALFGNLQTVTARQVGMDPILAVAANSSGGVAGKMISPLSLAVATAATGQVGKEGDLMRFTILHSILFAFFLSCLTLIQCWLAGMFGV